MDNELQRLLETESRAEAIARQAEQEKEQRIAATLVEARSEEARFEQRIPELQRSFIDKAEQRAEQSVLEIQKRFDERHAQLREQAEAREQEALDAAFQLLLDAER